MKHIIAAILFGLLITGRANCQAADTFTNDSEILAVSREDQTNAIRTKILKSEFTVSQAIVALTTFKKVTRERYLDFAHQIGVTGTVTLKGGKTYSWSIEPDYSATVKDLQGEKMYLVNSKLMGDEKADAVLPALPKERAETRKRDWPPRTTLEELNAMVKAGNYHLIRKQKIAHELEAVAVVKSVDGYWPLFTLPGGWWVQLHNFPNDHGLKPGDKIKFRALILDEAYDGLQLWAYSWSKETGTAKDEPSSNQPKSKSEPPSPVVIPR